MNTTTKNRATMTTATTMHRAAVDAQYRAMLEASGLVTTGLPEPVDAPDLTGLDAWTAATVGRDATIVMATCSSGFVTMWCDKG